MIIICNANGFLYGILLFHLDTLYDFPILTSKNIISSKNAYPFTSNRTGISTSVIHTQEFP